MWNDNLIRRGVLKLHPMPFVRCGVLNSRMLSEPAETCDSLVQRGDG